jgi:hypothetical protein
LFLSCGFTIFDIEAIWIWGIVYIYIIYLIKTS